MRMRFVVTVNIREPAYLNETFPSRGQVAGYLLDASSCWAGQLYPGGHCQDPELDDPADPLHCMGGAEISVQYTEAGQKVSCSNQEEN